MEFLVKLRTKDEGLFGLLELVFAGVFARGLLQMFCKKLKVQKDGKFSAIFWQLKKGNFLWLEDIPDLKFCIPICKAGAVY
jgi:hypothetical protein